MRGSSVLRALLAVGGLLLILTACLEAEIPLDKLFPGQVGHFLRISGPSLDVETEMNVANYQAPEGAVILRTRWVGADQIENALAGLPAGATEVGYDPALGQRDGIFFTFGNEYHAAWGNGDWIFVLSASTDTARRSFLGAYGY